MKNSIKQGSFKTNWLDMWFFIDKNYHLMIKAIFLGISIDLSKAFDAANHCILVRK